MSRALVLTDAIKKEIDAARAKARANPTPWELLRDHVVANDTATLDLADRKPGVEAITSRAVSVLIPAGFRAAISFEYQPAGLIRHLSVSVDTKGALPHPVAVDFLLQAFGFDVIEANTSKIWVEEFEPGHRAVNIVQLEVAA